MEPINGIDATADGNRFQSLSEPVIHHIFSFLETTDVMKARLVSREWRHLWTSMPHLRFDDLVFRQPYQKCKDFIDSVLLSTRDKSVCIQSFRLSWFGNKHGPSLNTWLHILAQKHVQQLYLQVHCSREEQFDLPRCLLLSDSLKVLELDLNGSVLKIPRHAAGFSRLKSLKLVGVCLLNRNSFGNFISSCPLLEDLNLECEFHGFKMLDISIENLRKLVIVCNCPPYIHLELELEIACPNLVYLDLNGAQLENIYWKKKLPSLQTAIIFQSWPFGIMLKEELAYRLLKNLQEFCDAEILKLPIHIFELIYPAVAEQGCFFSATFRNLKSLTLTGLTGSNCHFQSIIYFLKCAPNLQNLSFVPRLDYGGWGYNWKLPFPDEDIACLRSQLKMVKLIGIKTTDPELEMIGFFFRKGHVLEKMSITWRKSVVPESRREAIHKIMQLPRSSSCVTVSFEESFSSLDHLYMSLFHSDEL